MVLLVIEYWSLRFICNLVLVIWDLYKRLDVKKIRYFGVNLLC